MKHAGELTLKSFDTSGLKSPWTGIFADPQHGQPINLDASIRTVTPIVRTVDATAITSMATAIGSLPSEQEAIHMWIGGRHSLGHLLPAVLKLASPAVIRKCSIATLTFSKANADEWADLIDRGELANLTIITSVYFQKTSTGIYDHAVSILQPRGVDIFTLRCHAKLCCLSLSDETFVTAESSANTRSAKTLEQLTLFGSPQVYQFHESQIARGREMQGREYTGQKKQT